MKKTLLLTLVMTAGCVSQDTARVNGDPTGGGGVGSGGSAGSTSSGSGGLPCDVDMLLASRCQSCHGNPPVGGAPMALLSYDDLAKPALSDPTKRVADVALARMQSTTNPMPPAPAALPTAAEIATLQNWINAGLPMGSCGTDGGTNPFGGPTVCTSGQYWNGGGDGSSRMYPGRACIACHDSSGGEAPSFTIAGTVYPTGHEPDSCDGVAAGAQVVITDANGAVITLGVNSVGNFSYRGAVATPFAAKVVAGGAERAMVAHQTSGDCNSCHTVSGSQGAPGRIVSP